VNVAGPGRMRQVVLAILFWVRVSNGFPTNVLLLPNGRTFPAMGHEGGIGGNTLSSFGQDFLDCDGDWSCLCKRDSDKDGEWNGLELGDPCCTWKKGTEPLRLDEVSDPSDPESTCDISLPADFCSHEHSTAHHGKTVKQGKSVVAHILNAFTYCFFGYLCYRYFSGKDKPANAPSTKVAVLWAYLWSDLGSGILHIVLDNGVVQHWWLVGPWAVTFQEHHISPEVLSTVPTFLMIPFLIICYRKLPVFTLLTFTGIQLAYFCHWYSHQWLPFYAWRLVDCVIVSQSHHNVHHTSYVSDFAFVSGWTDLVLNALLQVVPRYFVKTWFVFGFGLWCILPLIVLFKVQWKASVVIGFSLLFFYLLSAEESLLNSHIIHTRSAANGAKDGKARDIVLNHREIIRHSFTEDGWIVIEDYVLDVTKWLPHHPGGVDAIFPYLGYNATEAFNEQGHSMHAEMMTKVYRVGLAVGEVPAPPDEDDDEPTDQELSIFASPRTSGCFGAPENDAGWKYDRVVRFKERYSKKTFGVRKSKELAARQMIDLSMLTPGLLDHTPEHLFYIRTAIPLTLGKDRLAMERWNISISSNKGRQQYYSALDIHERGEDFGRGVLECSGNTRSWHFGLLSQARWTRGVRMNTLLEPFIKKHKIKSSAVSILVTGYDKHTSPRGGVRGASWVFSWEQVLETGMFLATEMNGKHLEKDHGFPVRLVVPNWYGCTNIKWVESIQFVNGKKIKPTSQMREFKGRVHMKNAPKKSCAGWSGRQGLSATLTRAEKWVRGDGIPYLKLVGLFWGGQKKQLNPPLEFLVEHNNGTVPLKHRYMRENITEWGQFCSLIPYPNGKHVTVSIISPNEKIFAPRLKMDSKGTNRYSRVLKL